MTENREAWKLLEKVVTEGQQEVKKQRKWGIVWKGLTFAYLFTLIFLFQPSIDSLSIDSDESHVAVVNVKGEIKADSLGGADAINETLKAAFTHEHTKAVLLDINSPGGSPVEAGFIFREINRLRGEHPDIKVYAVIGELGASAAYYIASAADEIYADKSSLVGSIGVIASGFGFNGIMKNVGVDRRVYTSGDNKSFLDPFAEPKKEHVEFWKSTLSKTHTHFIQAVKEGRGDRLKENANLFSGLIWVGEEAKELGLIDGFGSKAEVAREVIELENLVSFSKRQPWFEKMAGGFGASFAKSMKSELLQTQNLTFK